MSTDDDKKLTFGLVRGSQNSADHSAFDDLAAWLRAEADVALEFRSTPTYDALAHSVLDGSSDIAWLPPVVYAWLAEAVDPLGCMLRGGRTSYTAALVVREDDTVRSLSDLQGARAGWVDPWSAAGYVVPKIELVRAGFDPTTTFRTEAFLGSHREALLALARGQCDVAGTYARQPESEGAPVEGAWSELDDVDVRVLTVFGSIPADVIAARRNLAPEAYEKVLEALRRAAADERGRTLLRSVFGGDAFREGVEQGHADLRRAVERATANGLFD
jgi:phosphate/phosphite/phosphonate ABC transporter binding protein